MRLKLAVVILLVALVNDVIAKQTVLVTGGLTGVGREISLAFVNDGWDVWATSLHPDKHEQIANVNIRQLDVTDSAAIKNLIKEIQTKHHRLDVLVNNVDIAIIGPEEAISVKQAQDIMAVNVIGPMQIIQAALPTMRKNQGGKIINISSAEDVKNVPGLGLYAASKTALETLSAALAAELSIWNISVSVVAPDVIKSKWTQSVTLAENLKEFPGYVTFTNKLRNQLWVRANTNGKDPREIGLLTLKIAKTHKPDFRYQTNYNSEQLAQEIFKDPSGNKQRDKATIVAKDLFDYKF